MFLGKWVYQHGISKFKLCSDLLLNYLIHLFIFDFRKYLLLLVMIECSLSYLSFNFTFQHKVLVLFNLIFSVL